MFVNEIEVTINEFEEKLLVMSESGVMEGFDEMKVGDDSVMFDEDDGTLKIGNEVVTCEVDTDVETVEVEEEIDVEGDGGGRGISKISTTSENSVLEFCPPPKNILFVDFVDARK
jgi:hypothetical protein